MVERGLLSNLDSRVFTGSVPQFGLSVVEVSYHCLQQTVHSRPSRLGRNFDLLPVCSTGSLPCRLDVEFPSHRQSIHVFPSGPSFLSTQIGSSSRTRSPFPSFDPDPFYLSRRTTKLSHSLHTPGQNRGIGFWTQGRLVCTHVQQSHTHHAHTYTPTRTYPPFPRLSTVYSVRFWVRHPTSTIVDKMFPQGLRRRS